MAVYTLSPFMGPILGPLLGGFINQNTSWRWTYRVQIIWVFVELMALLAVRISSHLLLPPRSACVSHPLLSFPAPILPYASIAEC